MADVRKLGAGRPSRGQLIIITGLVIAVSLVALTLLLNTAIFTENLASRGTAVGGENALEYQLTAKETTASLMITVNNKELDTFEKAKTNVSDGINTFDQTRTERYAEVGTSVNITNISFKEGERLRQTNASRNFTSESFSKQNWILADDVGELRRVKFEFHSVNDTSDPENGSFAINVNSDDWILYIHNDTDPTLKVTNSTETTTEVCNPGTNFPLQLNLTAATVNGEYCSDLEFTKSTNSPFHIEFERGDDATGTYNLTINGTKSEAANFNSLGGNSPYSYSVVYSSHFDVRFETEELMYRSTVRVAPGEQDD